MKVQALPAAVLAVAVAFPAQAYSPSPQFVLWIKALSEIHKVVELSTEGADVALEKLKAIEPKALAELEAHERRVEQHRVDRRVLDFNPPMDEIFSDDNDIRGGLRTRLQNVITQNEAELVRLETKRARLARERDFYRHRTREAEALADGLLTICLASSAFSRSACYAHFEMKYEIVHTTTGIATEYYRDLADYDREIEAQRRHIDDLTGLSDSLNAIDQTYRQVEHFRRTINEVHDDGPDFIPGSPGAAVDSGARAASVDAHRRDIDRISGQHRAAANASASDARARADRAHAIAQRNEAQGQAAMRRSLATDPMVSNSRGGNAGGSGSPSRRVGTGTDDASRTLTTIVISP